jgi:hypothetical protein
VMRAGERGEKDCRHFNTVRECLLEPWEERQEENY